MRRTNSELVAAWGNLVNRTASMISKKFGEIPPAGDFTAEDQELLDAVGAGFETVGGLIESHHQKAALAEIMRLVGEANRYVATTEPFKLKDESQRERLGTILHVLAQVVTDLNLMMSPFLPTSANAIDQVLGGAETWLPCHELRKSSTWM